MPTAERMSTVERPYDPKSTALRGIAAAFLSACLAISLGGCTPIPEDLGSKEIQPEEAAAVIETVIKPCQDPKAHWTYDGESGPGHWGALSSCFGFCEHGEEQSPIDLTAAVSTDLPALSFRYLPSPVRLINDGSTIKLLHDNRSSVGFEERSFSLRQLHFHAASEHLRDGVESPIEMHLVHSSPGGTLAVVGVFIEPGEDNAALASFWEYLPSEPGEAFDVEGVTLETAALLPTARTSWRYQGSLTTPPCIEGVQWIVMQEPITLSQEKIDAFTAIYDNNRRPTQPLGERMLERDGGAS